MRVFTSISPRRRGSYQLYLAAGTASQAALATLSFVCMLQVAAYIMSFVCMLQVAAYFMPYVCSLVVGFDPLATAFIRVVCLFAQRARAAKYTDALLCDCEGNGRLARALRSLTACGGVY